MYMYIYITGGSGEGDDRLMRAPMSTQFIPDAFPAHTSMSALMQWSPSCSRHIDALMRASAKYNLSELLRVSLRPSLALVIKGTIS